MGSQSANLKCGTNIITLVQGTHSKSARLNKDGSPNDVEEVGFQIAKLSRINKESKEIQPLKQKPWEQSTT